MKYAIIANPLSGQMSREEKEFLLSEASSTLEAPIFGLDTKSASELAQIAREQSRYFDVLVVAGGDGTFSDIMNEVNLSATVLAFIPLGTGNALAYALNYHGSIVDICHRIKYGQIHCYDLIDCCSRRKAFMVSVGIEGTILKNFHRFVQKGEPGVMAYLYASVNSFFKDYKSTRATIHVDDRRFVEKRLLSFMILKEPYYGFGMKMIPKASPYDHKLHVCCMSRDIAQVALASFASFTIGNRFGRYLTGECVRIKLDDPLLIQTDGNIGWESQEFIFNICSGILKIKY